jgi:hypothetical protein
LPEEVVNDSACRTIAAHERVDLGIEWAAPSLTKSKRRKDRNRIAGLENPDDSDVPRTGLRLLDW